MKEGNREQKEDNEKKKIGREKRMNEWTNEEEELLWTYTQHWT